MMGSDIISKATRAHTGEDESEYLPRSEHEGQKMYHDERRSDDDEKVAATKQRNGRDKIRCLDGLRGIACLLVFNYHFFWPWTPFIMLGHGAMPPGAPEPYSGWHQLPIVCLLHRGRPMVAIFFTISGFVLCRHILRAIHERRIDAAYRGLASSAFRRVFRLYIPPTISMFLVAMLAQMGAFKSEKAIYKGPDSAYINATVTFAHPQIGDACVNGTVAAAGAKDVAKYLHLQSPLTLGNITNMTGSTDHLCLNRTSHLFMPAQLYTFVDAQKALEERWANKTKKAKKAKTAVASGTHQEKPVGGQLGRLWAKHAAPIHDKLSLDDDDDDEDDQVNDKSPKAKKPRNAHNITWVQMGGSWEEHPLIHDNMTYALKNFTRVYAEWANPFNFNHYHARYDPHTFTIPMELRGSMFLYVFLLGTAAIKAKWRTGIGALLSIYSLVLGRWDMAAFMGGMVFSELDVRRTSDHHHHNDGLLGHPAKNDRGGGGGGGGGGRGNGLLHSISSAPATRWLVTILALHLLSYPDAAAEWTPGFAFLSSLVPRYYLRPSRWMFHQSLGAVMLLPCVLRSPVLVHLLEGRVPQYLGRVSFSLYLVHGPVLHSLGFWLMPRLFESFGRAQGYAIGWVVLMGVTLYLTDLWHRKIDGWSINVGRRVEKALLE